MLGLSAVALLVVAFGDVMLHDRFTLMAPTMFAVLVAVVIGFLLHEFFVARRRIEMADRQAAQLKSASTRLEQSLTAAAAFNARLNQSEQRYKGLVDAQGDAIFRRAPDSRLTYGNEAFFKLFGLNPQRALGRPFAPDLHPNCRAPMFGSFAGLESGRGSARYDQHVRTAYGWRWISWEDYALRDPHGRLVEVQSVGRDITERKALEDAITDARDKAEAGSRAKSGFLAMMSHEIRTPMNGVLGLASMLLETRLDPEQYHAVATIKESGDNLQRILNDILDLSKLEAGRLEFETIDFSPVALAEAVTSIIGAGAKHKGLAVNVELDPKLPSALSGDVGRTLRYTPSRTRRRRR